MKKIWNFDIKLKIGIGFAVILFVLVTIQYALNKSISNVIASQEEIIKSTELSTEVESIKSSICFFESKVKGYVLTGNDTLLEDNEKYLSDIVSKFRNLKTLSPSKEQIVSIDTLVSLLNAEIQFCDEVIFQYDVNKENALNLIKLGKGTMLMTRIILEFEHIHDLEKEKFADIIQRNQHYSTQVRRLDASAYVFAVLMIVLCTGMIYRDINKKQRLEKKLVIAQKKAEEAAIIKEQFMANMSHEIRTPMNAIIGFNERLGKTKLDEKQKEYVSAVQSSGENLLAIVNDILDFSKIEAGMVKIEEIPFNLHDLLHSVTTMFGQQAKEKKLLLKLDIADSVPACVKGDPTRLSQILINLIGNALKFTSEGEVEVTATVIRNIENRATVEFSVKDTGIGIPEDKVSEIFKRFTQAKSDTSRIYGGTGLGLSIARKLVELQDGKIRVSSVKGEGSEFSFFIPYEITEPIAVCKNNDNDETTIPFASNSRILVVEDNFMNQKLLGFILSDWGLNYDISANGKIAIEKLKSEKYALILMDIQMPEMNGYETTTYVREKMKLDYPIIAMTADALPGERDKCLHHGMNDYISKPIKASDLRNLIIKYMPENLKDKT